MSGFSDGEQLSLFSTDSGYNSIDDRVNTIESQVRDSLEEVGVDLSDYDRLSEQYGDNPKDYETIIHSISNVVESVDARDVVKEYIDRIKKSEGVEEAKNTALNFGQKLIDMHAY